MRKADHESQQKPSSPAAKQPRACNHATSADATSQQMRRTGRRIAAMLQSDHTSG